jgi:chromate transporter
MPTADKTDIARPVALAALFGAFQKAALCSLGGGLLAWTRRVVVEERRWMGEAEFADTLSLYQFLPGANIANLSVCVGGKLRGAAGAAAAFLGLTLLPLTAALLLGVGYHEIAGFALVRRVLGSVSSAAAGLVIATGLRMLLPQRHRPAALIFAALAFAGMTVSRLPLPLVLAVLAPLSIAAAARRRAR